MRLHRHTIRISGGIDTRESQTLHSRLSLQRQRQRRGSRNTLRRKPEYMQHHSAVVRVVGMLMAVPIRLTHVYFNVSLNQPSTRLKHQDSIKKVRAGLQIPATGIDNGDLLAIQCFQGIRTESRVIPRTLDMALREGKPISFEVRLLNASGMIRQELTIALRIGKNVE